MLPQHGGVPHDRARIPTPLLILFFLVLFTGTMLTISFHQHAIKGDVTSECRVRLSLLVTLLLSALVLLAGSKRLWHPHLWRKGNQPHSSRRRRRSSGHHHSSRHSEHRSHRRSSHRH